MSSLVHYALFKMVNSKAWSLISSAGITSLAGVKIGTEARGHAENLPNAIQMSRSLIKVNVPSDSISVSNLLRTVHPPYFVNARVCLYGL